MSATGGREGESWRVEHVVFSGDSETTLGFWASGLSAFISLSGLCANPLTRGNWKRRNGFFLQGNYE